MRRLAVVLSVTCSLLVAAIARADEPEPTPILPSWPAPAPVAVQHHPAARPDPKVTVPRGPRRDPALFGTGIALTGLGGGVLATGLYLVARGATDRPTFYLMATKKDPELVTAGIVTALAGAVLLAVGIPMFVHYGTREPPKTTAFQSLPDGLGLTF
jgi:hypothetical protein